MERFFAAALLVINTLLVVVVVGHRTTAAQEKGPPKHLADAIDLVRHLELKQTNYEHGQGHVTWSGVRESHTDCSGFMDALLTHSYGYDRDQFKKWFDSHRPSAARYHDTIVQQHGFTEIQQLSHVLPGDILAVKYLQRKENTGHVMLVADIPRRIQITQPVLNGTEQWEVGVIDSSKSGHGPTDTRHRKGAAGKDHDGLGAGVFRIYTDRNEKVVGFTWSTLGSSEFKDPADEHLVIGRLLPNFKP